MFKKLVVSSLLLALIVGLIGCGTPAQTPAATTQAAAATTAAAQTTAAEQTSAATEAETKELVEMTMYVNLTSWTTEWTSGEPTNRYTEIENITGVRLNFTSAAGANTADEKLNAMLAANDLPDLLLNERNHASFFSMPGTGRLIGLVGLLDEYYPEGRDLLPDSHYNFWKQDDGELYAWMNYFWADEQLDDDNYITSNAGFAGRGDLMEELGIVPEDFIKPDDFYNTLVKVKEANLQVEGGTVIPFAYTWNMFGDGYGVNIEGPDGNLRVTQKDPKTLEWLLFLNRLWNDGLMYPDQFTINEDVMRELLSQGRLFCAMVNQANVINRVVTNYELNNLPYTLIPLEVPGSSDGSRGFLESIGAAGWLGASVTTTCKYPEEAIKFIAYSHTQEGQILFNRGLEGVEWDWVDGRVTQKTDIANFKNENPEEGFRLYGGGFSIGYETALWQRIGAAPSTLGSMASNAFSMFSQNYSFNELAIWNTRPTTNTDEAVIETTVNEIWSMNVPQIITAPSQADATRLYDQAISELEAAGIDRLIEFRNELFQKNKEKLGIDFYYPPNRN
ncbi:MAG: hypothetical protein FWH01_15735 [Oscillospiraceae bacterium]|nr:hypothetical protein [Oscillospiraceae bacterium]